jgi:hypothetical protein
MQTIADQMQILMCHLNQSSDAKRDTGKSNQSPAKKKIRQEATSGESTINSPSNQDDEPTSSQLSPASQITVQTQQSQPASADQDEPQYTTPRFPGTAMDE